MAGKLTEPAVPRWRDRIFLALAKWEMERGDTENPRLRLKEMNQGSEKDELMELLALGLAKEKPLGSRRNARSNIRGVETDEPVRKAGQ